MTVAELIEALQQFDPDYEVVVRENRGCRIIDSVFDVWVHGPADDPEHVPWETIVDGMRLAVQL